MLPVGLHLEEDGVILLHTGVGQGNRFCLSFRHTTCGGRSSVCGDACGGSCAGSRALHVYAVVPVDFEIERIGEITEFHIVAPVDAVYFHLYALPVHIDGLHGRLGDFLFSLLRECLGSGHAAEEQNCQNQG